MDIFDNLFTIHVLVLSTLATTGHADVFVYRAT